MFSILIPSWNNLPYLKLCIDSIRRHSAFDHEIIVHVNDGSDGTLEWVRSEGILHTWSTGNVGVCLALNDVARLATRDWILFLNDDMFCTPGWDRAFEASLRGLGHSCAYLSAALIEPTGSANVSTADFGTGPENFDEAGLLAYSAGMRATDLDGVALQPMLISRQLWHAVGGYSIEFGPGMSSDNDFLMKLWLVGCRVFRSVGASRIYHFGCKSTGRIRRNRGGREFLMKWGISQRDFDREYIRRTASAAPGSLPNVPRAPFKSRVKRVLYALGRYPFEDLEGWEPDLPSKLTFMTPFAKQPDDKADGH
ncbi:MULTISPECIES: glycosyltransferase family 2 protein [Paraburkholderia]|uniref:Glycosyltransferase 2-like domain-containing protein n=1 Tax=Paraburkholderia aspalathi TaxID=1324617 RepID=A0ABN7LRW9_9BURK|nr:MULTISPECIES: glycosyltransferase [Paraburkholderia]MBK3820046.1 glycosyltransferase [Paraburkholderia aspalathi]MBK3831950.1 glycosyltransferase [Paraburkholderia aspalathi]MBK3838691.1 glycosyltransferase [Paraburkholderia aspalathi]MBK3861605.1 glycosyltransferase [Paraburkholderia aspalathi]MCX4139282.1 glycosyltransferase [Paraburkholderia aspalathi]